MLIFQANHIHGFAFPEKYELLSTKSIVVKYRQVPTPHRSLFIDRSIFSLPMNPLDWMTSTQWFLYFGEIREPIDYLLIVVPLNCRSPPTRPIKCITSLESAIELPGPDSSDGNCPCYLCSLDRTIPTPPPRQRLSSNELSEVGQFPQEREHYCRCAYDPS